MDPEAWILDHGREPAADLRADLLLEVIDPFSGDSQIRLVVTRDEFALREIPERELQVFTRIARGVSPAVMANELGLSVKTVSTYRARILEKMGMRSNAEIAAYAVRNQLVE